MNAMQLDVLERVAVDQLAAQVGGSRNARSPMSVDVDAVAVRRLVEMGLITDAADSPYGPRVRITPAGAEALVYLASVA